MPKIKSCKTCIFGLGQYNAENILERMSFKCENQAPLLKLPACITVKAQRIYKDGEIFTTRYQEGLASVITNCPAYAKF